MERVQIAVTGGTGHLGYCLIQNLVKNGYFVRALYRNNIPELKHSNLLWIKGDLTDVASLELLVEKASVMIHSASLISVGNQDAKEVYRVNVNGTQSILKVCQNRPIRMIYISSSVAVKETIDNQIHDENRPYKTETDFSYDWSKAVSEQLVLKDVKDKGLDAFILRPTSIVGPPDYRPSYFGQTIKDLALSNMPITIQGGYNLVDVRDVAQTIINSITLGSAGAVYLVGGNYIHLKQIAELLHPHKTFFSIPINVLIGLLPILKWYQKIFPLKWLITKESLITLKRAPKKIDSSKAMKHLNHQIRPTSETITDLIEWFKKEQENDFRNI